MALSSNVWQRLLQTFFSLGILYILFVLWPHRELLLFRLFLLVIALGAVCEVINLRVRGKGASQRVESGTRRSAIRRAPLQVLLGLTLPVCFFGWQFLAPPPTPRAINTLLVVCYALCALFALTQIPWKARHSSRDTFIKRVFSSGTNDSRLFFYLFVFLYPGLTIALLMLWSSHESAAFLIPFGLLAVALYDIGAYLWGKLLGRSNRALFYVSPQKSVAGLVGGTLTTVALFVALYPTGLFAIFKFSLFAQVALVLALVCAATLGDLFESSIKRAAGQKESGRAVPGRGGLLDSLDSHIFAQPLLYAIYSATL